MRPLRQEPGTGDRLVRFVGDTLTFRLHDSDGQGWPDGWRALLRTNLGRASAVRQEIIDSVRLRRPVPQGSWYDTPMTWRGHAWELTVPLCEVGFFQAKAYAVDERGWQHWPGGPDTGINVQPNHCRTANTIYCAFTRMFGPGKHAVHTLDPRREEELAKWDKLGYTVIPPSGKFRDLVKELPHIFEQLGCRILHLLPVNPVPTTYARFGRFGSPYACEDLTAIDPALVEFDRKTTGIDQFRELTAAAHALGGRVFLDMVINHTGWGSTLQENHPDWFHRQADGTFESPGAWGTIWEDLVELDQRIPGLREEIAEAFLEWCRRGVDGFRCDAGYKVPAPVWQYVTARVRQEFPETVFLLEGLGGAWEDTDALLAQGGMQWAYSELFQNYSGLQVSGYLDHALKASQQAGLLVHYSETHDNERLATRGKAWSLLRNRLCALASVSGGFGFTCGVEWLAPERINVHSSRGLAWGSSENLVSELGKLNHLLANHPCFFEGARLERVSPPGAPVYALLRTSEDGLDTVLALINTDPEKPQSCLLPPAVMEALRRPQHRFAPVDLLGQELPPPGTHDSGSFTLPPAAAYCLAATATPNGPHGETHRRNRAHTAFARLALAHTLPFAQAGEIDARPLAQQVEADVQGFLGGVGNLPATVTVQGFAAALESARHGYPRVITWRLADRTRVTVIPHDHWLVVEDTVPFRVTLKTLDGGFPQHLESFVVRQGHVACFRPVQRAGDAELAVERYPKGVEQVAGALRFLSPTPEPMTTLVSPPPGAVALLTNGRGGMARLLVDLGAIESKYDCLLGANLDADVPCDRHVFAKRVRIWINADGFLSPLNAANLAAFEMGPPAEWRFVANAGGGRTVVLMLRATMTPGRNTTLLRLARPLGDRDDTLPARCDVRLTLRVDIEDRNFHWETHRNGSADHHFNANCHTLPDRLGFAFTPAADRQLHVVSNTGQYHPQPEWCEGIPHPIEQSRGMPGAGDAFSPGWFEIPLPAGREAMLTVTADSDWTRTPAGVDLATLSEAESPTASPQLVDAFDRQLLHASRAFVVRRGREKTVIAGYPWFLDWGRDTLICARGLLTAGFHDEVMALLRAFGRFEQNGTLPNSLNANDASNRDTSDAPLWYGLVCEELARSLPEARDLLATPVDGSSRTVLDVLVSIGNHYLRGTPNGIHADPASGLVWSPAHFTWMDTNHPAATPREGYPISIQALWIRLLRFLDRLGAPAAVRPWREAANQAAASLDRFWMEDRGYLGDVLLATAGQSAAEATLDNALRCDCLFAVSLELVQGERARRCVSAAQRHLLIPGALRSLAPLPVHPPLPVRATDGRLLNNPNEPYWGRYEGDEDTRRKPAYHNGTAWVWVLPTFCESLVKAWDYDAGAVQASRAYLAGTERLLREHCLGHLPEIVDGDAPHRPRGCDAQAWSVTETLRVWRWLKSLG